MTLNTGKKTKNNWRSAIGIPSFFQNEEIFAQIDELDKLDKITHPWKSIQLQTHTSTENILV